MWSRRAIYHQGEGLRACGGHLAYPPSPMASAPACVVGPTAMVLLLLQSTSAFLMAPSTFHARRAHVLQPQQFRSPPLAMRTLEWRIFGVEVPVAETAEQQPNCEPHSILLTFANIPLSQSLDFLCTRGVYACVCPSARHAFRQCGA